jgi:hypothetical protein
MTQDLSQEKSEFDQISAAADDVTSNYTIIPNDLIRDPTISPNCRWLIIFLLSNKPGWVIKASQLSTHVTGFIGRDKVLKIFQEGIKAGYIKRDIITRPTVKGHLVRGYRYYVASTPKFKKCLRNPDFREPDFQGPKNTATKEVLSKEILSIRRDTSLKVSSKENEAKASDEKKIPSSKKIAPETMTVTMDILHAVSEAKPDYPPPRTLIPMMTQVDFMIRLDKRDPQKILDVFRWALSDDFWRAKMFKPNPPKYLREKFDQLEMQMMSKPASKERKFLPSSNDDNAREIARKMYEDSI